MPLKNSASNKARAENIAIEIEADKSKAQAVAIGFSKQSIMGLAAGLELTRTLQRLEKSGKLKPLRAEALKQDIRIFNLDRKSVV